MAGRQAEGRLRVAGGRVGGWVGGFDDNIHKRKKSARLARLGRLYFVLVGLRQATFVDDDPRGIHTTTSQLVMGLSDRG